MTPEQQLYARLRKIEERLDKIEEQLDIVKDNIQVHMDMIFRLQQEEDNDKA